MRFREKIKYWSKVCVLKTLYLCAIHGVLKNKQLIIYPKTKLIVRKNAKLNLGKGRLIFNFSHFGKRFRRFFCVVDIRNNASLCLENDDYILCEGVSILIEKNAKLVLKGKGFINTNSSIECYDYIEIGQETIISSNVSISDTDIHTPLYFGVKSNNTKPVIIGNHVWICRNVIIQKGVRIGDNSIIAAGSIVITDIPANCVAGGIPAKVLKENTNWIF